VHRRRLAAALVAPGAGNMSVPGIGRPEPPPALSQNMIRVALADDHPMALAGLRRLLAAYDDIEVVAESADGEELLGVVDSVPLDVVVTDIAMPNTDGLTALRLIRERHPALRVIVLSVDDSAKAIRAVLAAGAHGYLSKDVQGSELAMAVRTVAISGSYFGSGVIQRLAEPDRPALAQGLTERQFQILLLLAKGRSTKQIAFEMDLSGRTVEHHRRLIMEQLQVQDLANLTLYALRNGLIDT